MKLEVGKTYLTRDGQKVTIEAENPKQSTTYVMQGMDEQGRITWRSRHGRLDSRPHQLDLIAEAKE